MQNLCSRHGRDGVHGGRVQHERPGVGVSAVPGVPNKLDSGTCVVILLMLLSSLLLSHVPVSLGRMPPPRRKAGRVPSSEGAQRDNVASSVDFCVGFAGLLWNLLPLSVGHLDFAIFGDVRSSGDPCANCLLRSKGLIVALTVEVSLTRRRASTMDKREVAPTHARTTKLFRPMMTSAVPLVASGCRRGNSFLARFQENPEGRSSMKSLQGQWCRQRGSVLSGSPDQL